LKTNHLATLLSTSLMTKAAATKALFLSTFLAGKFHFLKKLSSCNFQDQKVPRTTSNWTSCHKKSPFYIIPSNKWPDQNVCKNIFSILYSRE
jgi:hypothetical protein